MRVCAGVGTRAPRSMLRSREVPSIRSGAGRGAASKPVPRKKGSQKKKKKKARLKDLHRRPSDGGVKWQDGCHHATMDVANKVTAMFPPAAQNTSFLGCCGFLKNMRSRL